MPVPSACLNNSGDNKSWKPKPMKPTFTHTSDKRVVTSFSVAPKDTASLPEEIMIVMEQALENGVPVQVQLEIIPHATLGQTIKDPDSQFPDAPGFYAYHCSIKSVKVRIKPGTDEFAGNEESNLNHIINGTEGSAEAEKQALQALQRMQKAAEKDAVNRFTGLEI